MRRPLAHYTPISLAVPVRLSGRYGLTLLLPIRRTAKPTVSAAAAADSKDATSVHYVYLCRKGAGDD